MAHNGIHKQCGGKHNSVNLEFLDIPYRILPMGKLKIGVLLSWRRGRDSNPRDQSPSLRAFQARLFVHSSTSPQIAGPTTLYLVSRECMPLHKLPIGKIAVISMLRDYNECQRIYAVIRLLSDFTNSYGLAIRYCMMISDIDGSSCQYV